MRWLEVTVNTTHEAADIVSGIFFDMGCQGVSVLDKDDILESLKDNIYWDYVDEELLKGSSDAVKITSFFLEEEYENRSDELFLRLEELSERSAFCGSLEVTTRLADDSDWENNWKKYYKPITIGKVQVIPEWLKEQAEDDKTVVCLDPGMAFGTGEHETTKMCLELMQGMGIEGKRIFDIGCGSGILGITAALLGAETAIMFDIDPTSVLTAQKNAEKNNVGDRAIVKHVNLLKEAGEPADAIFANITADVLIKLADDVAGRLKKAGTVVLSGIIKERKKEVADKYLSLGFTMDTEINMGDWCTLKLTLQRR
ncbi:MAG: 50S ribosomal protein L11 methyltransferase [Clostridiales bacterium]|jgi:ribosomal protein L11 methyltransferase|nr:50S ribosomal protein L11 methyltransferase [Clostridiales bacterium]